MTNTQSEEILCELEQIKRLLEEILDRIAPDRDRSERSAESETQNPGIASREAAIRRTEPAA